MLDWLRSKVLATADTLSVTATPHRPFTRSPQIVDDRSLAEKEAHYFGDIQRRWLYGPQAEFYWHTKPNDLGDMAIWQGCYTAMCAMKGDHKAVRRAFRGMELLQTLGGDNRLARGADKIGGHYSHDPSRTYFKDQGYVYTGNVSESTLIGHLYGLWAVLAFDTPADVKDRARTLADALAAQLVSDGYRMLDPDGTPARFGDLRPGWRTAPIRIAALCAALISGHNGLGNKSFLRRYNTVAHANRHSLRHLETNFANMIDPGYDDILAYMVLTVLCAYGKTRPHLTEAYRCALGNIWRKTRHQGNSFYIFTHKYLTRQTPYEFVDQGKITLEEFNTDRGNGYPTHKDGVERITPRDGLAWTAWGFGKFRKEVARQPLPMWSRPASDFVWQRSAYTLDGWKGAKTAHHIFNGMDFCLAYWLGKRAGAL